MTASPLCFVVLLLCQQPVCEYVPGWVCVYYKFVGSYHAIVVGLCKIFIYLGIPGIPRKWLPDNVV